MWFFEKCMLQLFRSLWFINIRTIRNETALGRIFVQLRNDLHLGKSTEGAVFGKDFLSTPEFDE